MMKVFGGAKHLMIPFQTVQLIEELPEDSPESARVRAFALIDGTKKLPLKSTRDKPVKDS
jgi:hypothetical protein